MSLISRSKASPRFGHDLQEVALPGASWLCSTSSVMPMMAFMGVRISWLMLARKALFARLAASAASLAWASSALARSNSAVRCRTRLLQLVARRPQFLFRLLALGHVVHQPREHPPPADADLADGKVHGEDRAVLPPADDLAADADDLALARAEIMLQVGVVPVVVGSGHQDFDVGADQFRQGVAEQALGGRIGRIDRAPLVDGDDAVDRRVENGGDAALHVPRLPVRRSTATPVIPPPCNSQKRSTEPPEARTSSELGASGSCSQSKKPSSAMAITLSRTGTPMSVSVVPLFQVSGEISPETTSMSTGRLMPEFVRVTVAASGGNTFPGLLCAAIQ